MWIYNKRQTLKRILLKITQRYESISQAIVPKKKLIIAKYNKNVHHINWWHSSVICHLSRWPINGPRSELEGDSTETSGS